MKKADFTVSVENGMFVKCDAQVRFTVKSGRGTLEDGLTPAATLNGAMTVASFTYNRLSYSGGVDWWNPSTGKPLAQAPKVTMRVRPEDVLTDGQECGCCKCLEERRVSSLETVPRDSRILESERKHHV